MEEKNKDIGDFQVYELGYHLLPTVSEDNLSSEISNIHSVLSNNGASVISEGIPSMRQLAYDISKKIDAKNLNFSKAYFGWIKFEMEKVNLENLNKEIKLLKNILRFIIVKTVKENTMSVLKAPVFKKEEVSDSKNITEQTEKIEISEEEIDKSIDELVVDENV